MLLIEQFSGNLSGQVGLTPRSLSVITSGYRITSREGANLRSLVSFMESCGISCIFDGSYQGIYTFAVQSGENANSFFKNLVSNATPFTFLH